MKKTGKAKSISIVTFLFSIILLSSIVLIAAQNTGDTNANVWARTAATGIVDVFNSAQINVTSTTTILLGILLWMILFSVVDSMGLFDKFGKLGTAIVALIITLLSFIVLPEGLIQTLALQFGVTGSVILTVIPFIIMLYFTLRVADNLLIAKAIWAIYTLYYFFIFIYALATSPAGDSGFFTPERTFYLLGMTAGLVLFLFIKKIRGWVISGELEAKEEVGYQRLRKRALGRELIEKETESMTEK